MWGFENGQLISKNSSLVLDIEGGNKIKKDIKASLNVIMLFQIKKKGDLRVGKKLIQYGRKKTM